MKASNYVSPIDETNIQIMCCLFKKIQISKYFKINSKNKNKEITKHKKQATECNCLLWCFYFVMLLAVFFYTVSSFYFVSLLAVFIFYAVS